MMYQIPTPCTPKRNMDEQLCYRFHKRLRLDPPGPEEEALAIPLYAGMNGLLGRLHSERLARRQTDSGASQASSGYPGMSMPMSGRSPSGSSACTASGPAATKFSLPDVVQCGHGDGGRCLHCSGRHVQDVPLHLYSAFCGAYTPQSGVPHHGQASLGRRSASELSFPAFVSLVACLAPEPGERLLHLGSGTGRAVAAWALLLPQSAACGVELASDLHHAAIGAAGRLGPDVQRRVFLHCGDIFATQDEWHQAGVIMVSSIGEDSSQLERFADGLQRVEPGTRVVAVSVPLCANPARAPPGLSLEREALYRTTGGGNTTVFIYRRLAPD
mmetsp:Transcript_149306/g.388430  ORF Transcript_149306/g.388430 Transcript_149306/m.388430 type:complete len:329 (-) Transcript_149306:173-1159(-)